MYPRQIYPHVEQFETRARRVAEQLQLAAERESLHRPVTEHTQPARRRRLKPQPRSSVSPAPCGK